jgi:Flp pilus assembly protein TadD
MRLSLGLLAWLCAASGVCAADARISPAQQAEALTRESVRLLNDKKLEAARGKLEQALKLNPKLAEGLVLIQKGDAEKAMATFESLVNAHPESTAARHNLGTALLQKGDIEGAIDGFRELTLPSSGAKGA